MPLTNPYQQLLDNNRGICVQLDISGEDKSLLTGFRPIRGTTQLLLSRLINNLCNDLRTLEVNYAADADTILTILTEPRNLNADQLHRLTESSVGRTADRLAAEVSAGILDNRRGPKVRQRATGSATEPSNPPSQVARGKQRDRKTSTEAQGG